MKEKLKSNMIVVALLGAFVFLLMGTTLTLFPEYEPSYEPSYQYVVITQQSRMTKVEYHIAASDTAVNRTVVEEFKRDWGQSIPASESSGSFLKVLQWLGDRGFTYVPIEVPGVNTVLTGAVQVYYFIRQKPGS